MHMLDVIATPAQKRRYLAPLAAGRTRSCFAMTEPAPGAGSDPSALRTEAVRKGDGWLVNGHKWFITGAAGAAFAICMAKTSGPGADGATMFLVDADNPGLRLIRQVESLDEGFTGGHWEVRFEDCYVDADAVLGEPGQGFRYAQVRLAPARLTHCMRWLGAARRAHDIATEYAAKRQAFGKSLAEHEGVGFMLADNEMDLHATRLCIWHCAWVLDQGQGGKHESSMAKVFASEAIWRVVDRCVQILGGQGVTHETVVARIFADVRAFRIYNGPSEVHRWSIARNLMNRRKGRVPA
jgi:alkylation response protein AidB-like acyl-CoA dehydrogenase